ncbi:daptomycin-sensing surface protein LiaX [Jeotgalibaca caeni]|uniref:daptomycin-sensing surface protein LiaX n=1 Tax=Jeotgalibaca caeni TaxID=3028623 RepID=UPI00237E2FFB|nr:daptomycin-sensing surface protein LiaX [Jeotgalibaca caeni]MDE1547726.1 daptomycin-sensing surface protein LiaX [Jeotgalibaca caeni]
MNERERILALVREGIISTEEAIELLENAAKKHGRDAMRQNKDEGFTEETETVTEEKTVEEEREEAEKKDRVNFEKILEELASEISFFSSRVDEKTEALQVLRRQISLKEDRRQELATHEELGGMTPEMEIEAMRLDEELESLRGQEQALREEKREMEEKMRTLKKEQLEKNVKSFSEKFGNKEEWKETANDLSGKLGKVGAQIGSFFSSTMNTVMDNVEWKEIDFNLNVPGLVSSKFSHDFVYENTTATILDFQIANGNIVFEKGDTEDIRIHADVKIYAKVEEGTPFEAFEARSHIEIDEDQLKFHVPNKRVRCDLLVTLPAREYDYVAFKILNGNLSLNDLSGKDVYVKSTNGKMTFTNLQATMLELDGVNGSIQVEDSNLVDLMAKLVNGTITTNSQIASSTLSVVNGDVKMTYLDTEMKRIEATSVNGTVKLAIPNEKSIELEANSSLGAIKNRMVDGEVVKQRDEKTNKHLQYRRLVDNAPVVVELKTTNGNIMLKDTDRK